MAYLLDADVFIRAKNLHYGLDFCPAFWEWLIQSNADGTVFSIEKVGDEVQALTDELSEWAGARVQDVAENRSSGFSRTSLRNALSFSISSRESFSCHAAFWNRRSATAAS